MMIQERLIKVKRGISTEGAIAMTILPIVGGITHSIPVALAIATVTYFLLSVSRRLSQRRAKSELERELPELLDHIISGIQSGMSLTASLCAMSERGPRSYSQSFKDFNDEISQGMNFSESISHLQEKVDLAIADQVFEALILGKTLGGTEILNLLRQLNEFVRSDLAFKEELYAKQSWIKNSAHLSAAAPWILLIILSLQPSTSEMYSKPAGVMVLLMGVAMTLIAYTWMNHLSHLPESRRIYGRR
jgi:tight adherence protein B